MHQAICYTSYGQDPFEAMAFDEYLLGRTLSCPELIAVHLYTWSRGTITFGLNQRVRKAVDHSRLGGTLLIRRITGGRALYHEPSELTYAIAASDIALLGRDDSPSGGGVGKRIAEGLSAFLKDQGILTEYVRQTSGGSNRPDYFHTAPCFDSRARHELVTAGHKIVASAQRRIGPVMLQHGAIKLAGVARHPALNTDLEEVDRIPVMPSNRFESLVSSFVKTVGSCLRVQIRFDELTAGQTREVSEAARLLRKNALDKRIIVKQ